MFNKDKDRLYLTLNHRFDQPGQLFFFRFHCQLIATLKWIKGFHWSFLFAPKDAAKGTDGETSGNDGYRWHATNEEANKGAGEWRFATNRVNQYKSISLCGRIILLKVNSSKRGYGAHH